MLNDKEKETGVYFTPPKVVFKGDKYREALSPVEKIIYQELYDMTKKAVHKGQVDEKGNVYVETSYIFLAVGTGLSDSTIQRALSKTTNALYRLGLLAIKKRKDKSTTQYYVMAPRYEGDDKIFLTQDAPTPAMIEKAKELSAKKNRKVIPKRDHENEKLEDERVFDTKADTADYQINHVEPTTENEVEQVDKFYFEILDNGNGEYDAKYIREINGKAIGAWSLYEFIEMKKLNINCNKRHLSKVMHDIMELGEYEIKYTEGSIPSEEYGMLMTKAKALGVRFHKAERMPELIAIIEKHFGVGKRLVDATTANIELLRSAVTEMNKQY